ncbi:MAB_1171c family putative transporter [Streptomyces sp. NPDC032472]|uniref:MAB_1171c family putative transporter n=1 Tax=Streptomyces sp. NPDC032472 TaxID=3155018 RepID=UPI0033EFA006
MLLLQSASRCRCRAHFGGLGRTPDGHLARQEVPAPPGRPGAGRQRALTAGLSRRHGPATGRDAPAGAAGSSPAGQRQQPAPAVGLATLILVICGMTLTAWGDRITAPLRRLRSHRDLRRTAPLWAALYAVRPEIALEPPVGLSGDPEFALYRRVIEIRDGQLALPVHLHPRVPEWAADACRAARLDERRTAATIEAAVLTAALEAAAAGRRYPYPATPGHAPPATPPDLHTESSRLTLVADAFIHCPIVAGIRRRVRADLHAGPVPGNAHPAEPT